MFTIHIQLDIEKDAWNWWHACNKISHGVDWKKRINSSWHSKLVGRTQAEAYNFLIPYLKNFYDGIDINIYIKKFQIDFDTKKESLFQTMERVTKRSIYRNDFTCYITSFPRYPYKYPEGFVWISYKEKTDNQLLTFIHELLHFQFFAYYGEQVWNVLGAEKHARLKEAMTVIINDEFSNITESKDKGYDMDKDLRVELLSLWRENRDMEKFIEGAIKILK